MTPAAILSHITALPATFTADQDWRLFNGIAMGYGLLEVAASLSVPYEATKTRWAAITRPLIVRGASGPYIPHEAQVALGANRITAGGYSAKERHDRSSKPPAALYQPSERH